jgi:hypothetical protein
MKRQSGKISREELTPVVSAALGQESPKVSWETPKNRIRLALDLLKPSSTLWFIAIAAWTIRRVGFRMDN